MPLVYYATSLHSSEAWSCKIQLWTPTKSVYIFWPKSWNNALNWRKWYFETTSVLINP